MSDPTWLSGLTPNQAGVFVAVATTADRDALSTDVRRAKMLVRTADGVFYELGAGLTNSDWTVASFGSGGGGSGDVVGPASSVDDRLALFNGLTGKLIKVSSFLVGDLIKKNGSVPWTSDQSLGGNAFTNVKSVTYGSAPVDNGNSGTSKLVNWQSGDIQKITLTGNVVLTYTAPLGVGGLTLEIIQDGTGGRSITWPATIDWASGVVPTIAAAAGAVSIVTFYWNGTRYRGFSGSGGGTAGDGLTGTSTLSVLPNGTTLSVAPAGVKLRNGAAAGQEWLWDGTAWQLIGRKTGTALGDANVTVQFSTAAQYIWPVATNTTANRTITLGTTGLAAGPNAGVGAIINVFLLRASYANSIAFINGGAGAGTLFTLPASGSDPVAVSFFYDGTNWSLAGWEFLGTVTAA